MSAHAYDWNFGDEIRPRLPEPEPTKTGGQVVASGYEFDRHPEQSAGIGIRWWVYVFIPGEKLRNQRARLGVPDRGFHFARGGRAWSAEQAQDRIREAYEVAQHEARIWTGQPSHSLGPNGELIPVDDLPELTA